MHQKKTSLEINKSQLDKNIAMLEKDMEKDPERSAEIRKEQESLLQLYYKLRRVAFVDSQRLLITVITNFAVINTIILIISGINGIIDFSLIKLFTLFVCSFSAHLFFLGFIKAWVAIRATKINQRIKDTIATLTALGDHKIK